MRAESYSLASHSKRSWERWSRSEEHTSELQSRLHLVCRLLLEKKISHVVDAYCGVEGIGTKADDKVQHGEIDHAAAQAPHLVALHRQQLRAEQRDQHTGETHDG